QTSSSTSATFSFPSPGAVTVTLNVTNGGSTVCSQQVNLVVNALPIPDFTMTSPSPQCYNGNYFCFQDNSQPGTGRTLTKAVFLFGDGGVDSTTGPGGQYCHFYPNQNGG